VFFITALFHPKFEVVTVNYFVNGRFLTQRLTGVQRYALEITRCLVTLVPGLRVLVPQDTVIPAELSPYTDEIGRLKGYAWEQLELPLHVLKRGGRLWSPSTIGPLLLGRQQHLVTIHDLFAFDHPEYVSRGIHLVHRLALPRLARVSDPLLTVSEYSKAALVTKFGLMPERVLITFNGIDKRFWDVPISEAQRVKNKYDLPDTFILTLASIERRKNLRGTFEAWQHVARARKIALVVAGGIANKQVFGEVDASLISALESQAECRLLGYVPDEDLPGLYVASSLFVYPSFAEGFGIPVLEALASGTKAVTSDTSALRELFSSFATLVNPRDPKDIARGILATLSQPRDHTKAERIRNTYQWSRSAEVVAKALLTSEKNEPLVNHARVS
jgi:glycosyltransferase involved in cell wall biosynthesis